MILRQHISKYVFKISYTIEKSIQFLLLSKSDGIFVTWLNRYQLFRTSVIKIQNFQSRVLEVISRLLVLNRRNFRLKNVITPTRYPNIHCYKPILFLFIWPTKTKLSPEIKVEFTPSVIEIADRLFESGKYEECHKVLINCEMQDDIEIKWRTCRVMYNMAKLSKYDQDYKCELISQAYSIIAKELDSNWDNFAVQKWYALILDVKSSNDGIKRRIEELGNVKKHMEIAIKLNPNDATLLHMLGEWCYQIAEVPWHQRKTVDTLFAELPYSSYEDALDYFLKAEAAQPRFYSMNLLRLGCCYLKLNQKDQAKYYLKLAASYPAKSNDDHHANKEATELLKKLKVNKF